MDTMSQTLDEDNARLSVSENAKDSNEKSCRILFYGLLLFFVFEYARPGYHIPILRILKLNSLIPLSVFIFSVFSRNDIENSRILKSHNARWLSFFLFLIVVSVLTADVTLYAYTIFKVVFSYLIIFFVIRKQVTDVGRMKALFATLTAVHVFVALMSPDIILQPETRSYLTGVTFLGDGNDFALSVCIVIPYAFFLFQEAKRKATKYIFLILLIGLILCVIGTQSRGGSLALGFMILYQWIKSKKKIIGAALIVLLVSSVFTYAPSQYFDRINSIVEYHKDGSASGRIMAWQSAIRMASANPLLGVGAGHFQVKFGIEYRPPGVGRTEVPWLTAHSIYFLILGEFGFPGIIFLLGIISYNLLANERRLKEMKNHGTNLGITYQRLLISLNSSLIAFAVGGAFLSAIYYPHIYVLAGLFGSAEYFYEKSKGHVLEGAGQRYIAQH